MKAMVLAAGLGTRLRPLTDDRPKALVELNGRTLLEIVLARLRDIGIHEVVVNAHHFADKLMDYLRANGNFGMRVEVSVEDVLLDTGGGVKKAAQFLTADSSNEPFLLHNVDVLSDIDLRAMGEFHQQHDGLATLAVKRRESSRYLLFDQESRLCGRRTEAKNGAGRTETVRAVSNPQALAFCGIHVISPRIFGLMQEQGVFSIVDVYLRLARAGESIVAFPADRYYWRDLGKPENITQACEDLRRGLLTLS